jgi:hypothetical protein
MHKTRMRFYLPIIQYAHFKKTKYVSYAKLGLGCTYASKNPFVKTKYVLQTKLGLGCTCV